MIRYSAEDLWLAVERFAQTKNFLWKKEDYDEKIAPKIQRFRAGRPFSRRVFHSRQLRYKAAEGCRTAAGSPAMRGQLGRARCR